MSIIAQEADPPMIRYSTAPAAAPAVGVFGLLTADLYRRWPRRWTGHGILPCLAVAICMMLTPSLVAAQSGSDDDREIAADADGQIPEEPPWDVVTDALDADTEDWMNALAILRTDPERARSSILNVLKQEEPPRRRWRLIHHLTEFGGEADIEPLVLLLRETDSPWERRIIAGSIRGLYRPARQPTENTVLVDDFAYLQSRPAEPYRPDQTGKYFISAQVMADYHRLGLHPKLIDKMRRFRRRGFASKKDMVKAVRPSFGHREWNDNWKVLLAPFTPYPERSTMEGVLRLSIYNPNPRPMLVEAAFDVWYGRFVKVPNTQFLYVPAEQSSALELTVGLIGTVGGEPLRVDLRIRESGGPRFFLNQKILVDF